MARFYSDITKKLYDSMEELDEAEATEQKRREEAEAKQKKRADERKSRAKELEDLQKAYSRARKAYNDALHQFCKDYGSFHTSISADNLFDFLVDWM